MRAALRDSYHFCIKLVWIALRPIVTWKVSRSNTKVAITCNRDDGGGAQLHGRISSLAFARAVGLQFFHTPLTRVHFSQGDLDLAKWNNVIKFEQIAPTVTSEMRLETIRSLPSLIFRLLSTSNRTDSICFQVAHCHGFTDRFPETISRLIPELKMNMGQTLNAAGAGCSDTVIHVRGEIGGVSKDSPRRSSLRVIKSKISQSIEKKGASKVVVFTSELDEELISLETERVRLDYKTDVFGVLNCMVQAKDLYLAKSSLSYVAGILCSGAVYYESFWHPMLEHWEKLEH